MPSSRAASSAPFGLFFAFVAATAACGSPPPPAAPTSEALPTPAASAASPVAEAPKEPAVEKPADPAKPVVKALPASKHTVNGVSISTATAQDFQVVLEKLGWKVDPAGIQPKVKFGRVERFSVVGYKGPVLDKTTKEFFVIGIDRMTPVSDPQHADSEANFQPKKLRDMFTKANPKLVPVFDEEAEVLVSAMVLKGVKDAELQKIVDATVVKAK